MDKTDLPPPGHCLENDLPLAVRCAECTGTGNIHTNVYWGSARTVWGMGPRKPGNWRRAESHGQVKGYTARPPRLIRWLKCC